MFYLIIEVSKPAVAYHLAANNLLQIFYPMDTEPVLCEPNTKTSLLRI